MHPRLTGPGAKWRPNLAMITAGMIASIVAFAFLGFGAYRFAIPQPAGLEIAIALLIALAGGSAVGWAFVRTITKPMRELAARADAIAHGDRSVIGPLSHHGSRELAAVTESFMAMAQSLSKRSDYVRTFARHVSHELKSPLTAIKGAAELVRDTGDMSPADRARFLTNVVADVDRLTALLDRLNELARSDSVDFGGRASVSDVEADLRAQFGALTLRVEGDATARTALSRDSLSIIFAHLLDNAHKHGARAVAIRVRTLGDRLVIEVEDDGDGVSAGNRATIFDPFFTTRRSEGGTGMGLPIVSAILAAHDGSIRLCDSAKGARFVIETPAA